MNIQGRLDSLLSFKIHADSITVNFHFGVIFSGYKKKRAFHVYFASASIGQESDFLLPRKLYLFLIF